MTRGRPALLLALGVALYGGASSGSAQLGSPAPRTALPRGNLELHAAIETIVTAAASDGEPLSTLVPVALPVPGDEVVYTVTFVNVSDGAVGNIRISNPIPAQMSYLPDTAFAPGSQVLYSVDGGRTYGLPSELFVTVDGSRRTAQAAAYTHIRWLLRSPLDAGAKGFARFRAVVREPPGDAAR